MINDKLKSIDYYEKNKRKFNKNYNDIWKKIAGWSYIGKCSYLFQMFYKEWKKDGHTEDPTPNDFAKYYFSHTNPNDDEGLRKEKSQEYGRSVEDLKKLAEHYQKACNNYNIPLEEYFDDIVNHAIVETTSGQLMELKLFDEYEKNGFTVEHTNNHWDKNLGVDLIIKKDGIIRDYIQCKPISTFRGEGNNSLISDRKMFFKKELEKKKECEKENLPYTPTKFILYDKNQPGKWCYIGKRRGFLLEELCDRNGRVIIDVNKVHYE